MVARPQWYKAVRYKAVAGQLRLLVGLGADWKSCRLLMRMMMIRLDRARCFFALLMLLMRAVLV
jgi:hypothetical protein